MKDCIFCTIIRGEIDSAKIWEDNDFLAILDINPNTKGMTLVLTKKHHPSYAMEMEEEIYKKFFLAAKKVSKILERGLNVKRVALVMEGMGINHAHLKLYPLHGLEEKFKEMLSDKKVFFEKYPGYLSTELGPQKSLEELKQLAKEIKTKSLQ